MPARTGAVSQQSRLHGTAATPVGVGWRSDYYEVVIGKGAELTRIRHRHHEPGLASLVQTLGEIDREVDGGLTCLMDTSNGLIFPRLQKAGLRVSRIDGLRSDGSASADPEDMVRIAREQPERLVDLEEYFLEGCYDAFWAQVEESSAYAAELAERNLLLYNGRRDLPEVALTFDDGPEMPCTPQVLDILRDRGALATFFCTGLQAAAQPETLRRIADEGHSIGNHTWSHGNPSTSHLWHSTPSSIEQAQRSKAYAAGIRNCSGRLMEGGVHSCWRTSQSGDWSRCSSMSSRRTGAGPVPRS